MAVNAAWPLRGGLGVWRGVVRGRMKKGRVDVDTRRMPDGSLIQPTPKAREHVRAVLLKSGLDTKAVEQHRVAVDALPANDVLKLPGITVVKREGRWTMPTLDEPEVSSGVLLKIAFEFLACHLGDQIYGTGSHLEDLRSAILSGNPECHGVEIEYLTTREYEPVHGLALAGKPHAIATICLFGQLRYRVYLRRIAVGTPTCVYTHLLDSGDEAVAIMPEGRPPDAEAGLETPRGD